MPRRRHRARRLRNSRPPAELDITAFMNLMVVLVPFLLIMAVFSRMTVLQLELPANDAPAATAQPDTAPDLALTVVVRASRIEVRDANKGVLAVFPREGDDRQVFAQLGEKLVSLKQQHPLLSSAAVLMEEDIPYETLVAVMDRVRERAPGQGEPRILFPEIAIGDAPAEQPMSAEHLALRHRGEG